MWLGVLMLTLCFSSAFVFWMNQLQLALSTISLPCLFCLVYQFVSFQKIFFWQKLEINLSLSVLFATIASRLLFLLNETPHFSVNIQRYFECHIAFIYLRVCKDDWIGCLDVMQWLLTGLSKMFVLEWILASLANM